MQLFRSNNYTIYKLKLKTIANSVYNQLLGIKLRILSLWGTLVYLDTESLWQRK